MAAPELFVGLDVSKDRLDAATHDGASFTFANDAAGQAQLLQQLRPLGVTLVVVEATGGWNCPWRPCWPPAACRSPSSTRGRSATSPGHRPTGQE